MEALKFEELKAGMLVIDQDGDSGRIVKCDDVCNIEVSYDDGGNGFICLSANCKLEKCAIPDALYLNEEKK